MATIRFFLIILALVIPLRSMLQAQPWQDYQPLTAQKNLASVTDYTYQKGRWLSLNEEQMQELLILSAADKSVFDQNKQFQNKTISVILPLPNGTDISVSIYETSLLPPGLAERYPTIKTYQILPDAMIATGRIEYTYQGFHATLLMRSGESIFIDPDKTKQKKPLYISYRKQDQQQGDHQFSCGAEQLTSDSLSISKQSRSTNHQSRADKPPIIQYRLAVAATGEYTLAQGGTKEMALSAMITTIDRVNMVFENDLGIRLVLVENNQLLIFEDPASDPYSAGTIKGLLNQNQALIDLLIGNQNYDVGHLFTTRGGGLAAIGSVCDRYRKAQGISGISHPYNDSFNLDFVAHELGHQLGATHTFNGVQGLCSNDTRDAVTAYEPGSGSTIMSYAGYCGDDNLQANTDPMLHIGSILQIRDNVESGKGKHCGIRVSSNNQVPLVSASHDYTIPANTPFELTGSALDPDGDPLSYSWEQYDAGKASIVDKDEQDNALLRVNIPRREATRIIPPLADILQHSNTKGEVLPVQARRLHFKLVVRDGQNTAQSDSMTVYVVRTGSRFALNLPRSYYLRGDTYPVYWNVANTVQAPIHCNNINISLSTDGGETFATLLAEQVPNTGKAWVTIPTDSQISYAARFKIRCTNNIFFAISYRDFSIIDLGDASHVIVNPGEDQPEPNLEDVRLSDSTNDVDVSAEDTAQKEGGGSIDWLLLALLGVYWKKKYQVLCQSINNA